MTPTIIVFIALSLHKTCASPCNVRPTLDILKTRLVVLLSPIRWQQNSNVCVHMDKWKVTLLPYCHALSACTHDITRIHHLVAITIVYMIVNNLVAVPSTQLKPNTREPIPPGRVITKVLGHQHQWFPCVSQLYISRGRLAWWLLAFFAQCWLIDDVEDLMNLATPVYPN